MTPLELADRIEAATVASRDLDYRIEEARKPFIKVLPDGMGGHFLMIDGARYPASNVLRYSSSLDAAMSLVPEGVERLPLSFKVERFYLGNGVTKCRAAVWDGLGGVSSLDTASEATTPALALCAAALRARAAGGAA